MSTATNTEARARRVDFLAGHGAGALAHSSQRLIDHLQGVADLLRQWGEREALCDAGLFHSSYGTEIYPTRAVPIELRPVVCDLIGPEAEQLAYLFGTMERLSLYDNLYDGAPYTLTDRTCGSVVPIPLGVFEDLCALTVANWLEQRPRFPLHEQFSRRRDFELMRPFLRDGARRALDSAYGF